MSEAIVRLRGPDTDWLHLAVDTPGKGMKAEGLTLSANEQGPDTCAFTLKRSPRFTWPDLLPFAFCEVEVAGTVVWGGRIWETPGQDGTGKSLSVTGRGWQYHLDDDFYERTYAMSDVTAYVDQRSKATAQLTFFRAAAQAGVGEGVVTLLWPNGFAVVVGDSVAVTLDFGGAPVKRAIVTWERVGISDSGTTLYSRGSTSEDALGGTTDDATAVLTSASGTLAHTFAAARRYHHLLINRGSAPGTFANDQGVRISAVKLFGETAYESGNASVLKASQVVTDVLASGKLPLLDATTSQIETTAFSIPDYAPEGSIVPRDHIAAVNAYHDNLWGVDAQRRLYFKARPTTTSLETGAWAGADYSDSGGGAERLYNKVLVSYTGPDGVSAEESVTATSSLLNRLGFTRTARLNVSAAITSTAAAQIGGVWISEKTTPSLKGSLNLKGHGAVRTTQGIGLDPAHLLLKAGQMIRLTHRQDSNGGIGLDGTIKSVTYNHEARSVGLELDQERGRFEALMARLGVVQAAVR